MRKNIRIIGISAILPVLALAAGCSQEQYELQNMVSEDYHKVFSFKDPGTMNATIYDIGVETSVRFTVLRGGSDPSLPCSYTVNRMTQEEVNVYSADYVLLPENYYTLVSNTSEGDSVYVAPGEPVGVFEASFSPEQVQEVKAAMETLPSGSSYCLAFRISSSDATVNTSNDYVIRPLTVSSLGFTVSSSASTVSGLSGYDDMTRYSIGALPEYTVSVDGGVACPFDVPITVRYSPDLVETYNEENLTFYETLPVEAVSFGTEDFTVGEGETGISFSLSVDTDELEGTGIYLVPVEVLNETYEIGGGVQAEGEIPGTVYYVVVEKDPIPLSTQNFWCPFDVTYDGQGIAGLSDSNLDTYWHSPWQSPAYVNETYGHYFQVRFDEPLTNSFRVEWWPRHNNNANDTGPRQIEIYATSDTPAGETEASYDAMDWKLVYTAQDTDFSGSKCPWPFGTGDTAWLSPEIFLEALGGEPATYIRYCVKRTNGGVLGTGSTTSTCLSEFKMWGE